MKKIYQNHFTGVRHTRHSISPVCNTMGNQYAACISQLSYRSSDFPSVLATAKSWRNPPPTHFYRCATHRAISTVLVLPRLGTARFPFIWGGGGLPCWVYNIFSCFWSSNSFPSKLQCKSSASPQPPIEMKPCTFIIWLPRCVAHW